MGEHKKTKTDDDGGVFRPLFVTFFPKVKAMLIRQGADKETAEEIAQDTMLTVWRKKHQFCNNKGSVSAWIYAIARNLRIDRVRKQAVWQRCYAELEAAERLREEANYAVSWLGERNDIESAFRELPPEQLKIIKLSFLDGLSQSDIAAKLGLPLGTVKSRMRLAFEKLRSATGEEDGA